MEKYFNVNRDGCSICCKLYSDGAKKTEKVVLCGHGFAGHRDNKAAEKFAGKLLAKNKGVAVITFDWPCHGSDVRKSLRLEDCAHYFEIMVGYIEETYSDPELYGYATSFGGYLFLKSISENGDPFKKLALRCPAVNMYDVLTKNIMTGDDLLKLEKGKPVLVGFDSKIKIDKPFIESLKAEDISGRDFFDYAEDILILHGTEDEIVPFDAVERFADNSLIEFVPVEGADHRFLDPLKMEQAIKRITAFFGMK